MIIIGIDPGTAKTGFGVIRKIPGLKSKNRNKIKCLGYGVIKTNPNFPPGERLKKINNELNKLINKYKPAVLAVEGIFFFKNLKTALPVGQAKGVILLTAAKKNVPVYEFTPLQIKMAITGYGRAEKKQVQKMIKTLLNLKEIPCPDDAADALAIAICCLNFLKVK
jgi:crossover junction endodeoxyribonuclease RuvC